MATTPFSFPMQGSGTPLSGANFTTNPITPVYVPATGRSQQTGVTGLGLSGVTLPGVTASTGLGATGSGTTGFGGILPSVSNSSGVIPPAGAIGSPLPSNPLSGILPPGGMNLPGATAGSPPGFLAGSGLSSPALPVITGSNNLLDQLLRQTQGQNQGQTNFPDPGGNSPLLRPPNPNSSIFNRADTLATLDPQEALQLGAQLATIS